MRLDLLQLCADKVRVWPRSRFNFNKWVGEDWKGLPDLSCGTTACALGIATTIPEIYSLGLCLVRDECNHTYVSLREKEAVICSFISDSIKAAHLIFEIPIVHAYYLFMPKTNPPQDLPDFPRSPLDDATNEQVADHLQHYITFMKVVK